MVFYLNFSIPYKKLKILNSVNLQAVFTERAASRSSANALTAGKGKDVTSLCVDLVVTFAPATAGHSL